VKATPLPLPDVAELVGDEIVADVAVAEQDRPPERIPGEPPKERKPEEPRCDDDTDAVDRDRPRVVVEAVEPGLRALEGRPEVEVARQELTIGVRTMIGLPSCPCT